MSPTIRSDPRPVSDSERVGFPDERPQRNNHKYTTTEGEGFRVPFLPFYSLDDLLNSLSSTVSDRPSVSE